MPERKDSSDSCPPWAVEGSTVAETLSTYQIATQLGAERQVLVP